MRERIKTLHNKLQNAEAAKKLAVKEADVMRQQALEEQTSKQVAETSKDISESILQMKKDKIERLQDEIEKNAGLVESAEARVLLAEEAAAEMLREAEIGKRDAIEARNELKKEKEEHMKALKEESGMRTKLEREVRDAREEHERDVIALSSTHSRQMTRLEHDLAMEKDEASRELARVKAETDAVEMVLQDKLKRANERVEEEQEDKRKMVERKEREHIAEIKALEERRVIEEERAKGAEEELILRDATIEELNREIERLKKMPKDDRKGPNWKTAGNKSGLFSQPKYMHPDAGSCLSRSPSRSALKPENANYSRSENMPPSRDTVGMSVVNF